MRLFIWLWVVDSVVAVTVDLVWQWISLGFDAIFYNPIFVAALALVFVAIESYLPFLVLFALVFNVVAKKLPTLRLSAVCGLLLVVLLIVSLVVALLSFGREIDLIDVLVPVGLACLNVAAFYRSRIRATSPGVVASELAGTQPPAPRGFKRGS